MKKFLKGVLCTIICFFTCFFWLCVIVFVGEKLIFLDFYSNIEVLGKMPGRWSGFVAQGFDQLEDGTYLMSGYDMGEGKPSIIYVITEQENTRCNLYEADGSAYISHAGGIAHFGDYIYVANNNGGESATCDMFLRSDVLDGDGKATLCDSFSVPNRLAYCAIYDGKFYGGAFYMEDSQYKTPDAHHLTTPCGDKNTALMTVFDLNPATGKLLDEIPEHVYSTTSKVQGMCLTQSGKIVFSTSYGLPPSYLYVYDTSKADTGVFDFNGVSVPLTYLDTTCLIDEIMCPPMSEGMEYKDGKVSLFFESASMKYLFGKITGAYFIYGYPVA